MGDSSMSNSLYNNFMLSKMQCMPANHFVVQNIHYSQFLLFDVIHKFDFRDYLAYIVEITVDD